MVFSNSLSVIIYLLLISLLSPPVMAKRSSLTIASKQLQQGYYRAALSNYQQALTTAQKQTSIKPQQLALAGLGHTLYLLNQPQQALDYLQQALKLSNQTDRASAQIHYYLTLVATQLNQPELIKTHWRQAMVLAKQQADTVLQAYLYLAKIKTETDSSKLNQQLQQLNDFLTAHSSPSQPEKWGAIYLSAAEYLIQHPLLPTLSENSWRIERSYHYLQQAQHLLPATAIRAQAQVKGFSGLLYEAEQRPQEALSLTQQALQKAQSIGAKDLQMLYEWQAGRLYQKQAHIDLAIDSYRRAVAYVNAIRQDIPVRYQNGKSSFKQLLGPLYRNLADLVLQQAWQKQNPAKQNLLAEAKDLLETLKLTELEDFFQDRCLLRNQQTFSLAELDRNTAILYPVLLADRFEWLIGINGQLEQVQIQEKGDTIDWQIRQYAEDLRNGRDNNSNQELYQLLFKPLESLLQHAQIKTLIYIPDGVLRLLPIGVLSDGKSYLIEHYAIATLPGMNLLNQQTEESSGNKSLLVGLSQPSVSVVGQLPASLLRSYIPETTERGLHIKSRAVRVAVQGNLTKQINSSLNRQRALEELATELALPGVADEIKQLAGHLKNKTLLNQDFTLANFQQQAARSDYHVIHIASHGFFSGDSKDSFIMTYNKLLTIDKLEQLLKGRQQDKPLAMLTLSACQTAEGDDRAPLGLAGVAIKANAQTALGSLWPISDQAAVKLMTHFYQYWLVEHKTKARALQLAQQNLLHDPQMSNPFYWAPFILVGQWQQ